MKPQTLHSRYGLIIKYLNLYISQWTEYGTVDIIITVPFEV